MKIGIDASFFQFPATGTGQYMSHLLAALAEVDTKNEYILLGPHSLEIGKTPFPYQIHPVPAVAARNKNIEKVMWEQAIGPGAAHRVGVDLYHVPYFAPPLFPRTPIVVTIHDVIPLRLPDYQPDSKVKLYMNMVARAAHRAAMVITVSQHAKQDIMEVLHLPANKIRVIYHAAGDECRPITDAAVLADARQRYGLGESYIFYLGGLDRRKNVPALIRAFAQAYHQIGDPDLQLLISGNPDKQRGPLFPDPRPVAAELGMDKQILFRFVKDEDKAAIYSAARLFVFPSLYEGFGLDPLEAMSCGAPVVCSNRTSLPEVVGDAALTVDPEDRQALTDAITRVLADEQLRTDLQARSLQQAARFNWRKAATETLSVYEEALSFKENKMKKQDTACVF
ncbi:MAG TPA: glycosyltransferase family 1 protein [Ktedonobacteraceae bacterium]|jgi:glycosyltransferase involved in cell wall biosynthesis